jgi:glycine betaine/choline ABC-type transport system substrate-binding protein
VFGFQHVALVIDEDKLDELGGRKFMRIIDDVNGRLTTSAMIQMNRDVDVDGQDAAIVAERFLRTAGLLG